MHARTVRLGHLPEMLRKVCARLSLPRSLHSQSLSNFSNSLFSSFCLVPLVRCRSLCFIIKARTFHPPPRLYHFFNLVITLLISNHAHYFMDRKNFLRGRLVFIDHLDSMPHVFFRVTAALYDKNWKLPFEVFLIFFTYMSTNGWIGYKEKSGELFFLKGPRL